MWMPSGLASEFSSYSGSVWRLVEGQHRISTNRLATNLDDQTRLEELVETAKPDLPPAAVGLHYLLASPFRYGHKTPSRFRHADERPGIFYASESETTALTEAAYWRLRFLSASIDFVPPTAVVEYTSFSADVATDRALDLTKPPFDARETHWTDPLDYRACQDFGTAARAVVTGLIRTRSARDKPDGVNIVVLDPAVFSSADPVVGHTWHMRFEDNLLAAFAAFPSAMRFAFVPEQFGLAVARLPG